MIDNFENVLIFGNLLREIDEVQFAPLQKLLIAVLINPQHSHYLELILNFNQLIMVFGGPEPLHDAHQLSCNFLKQMTIANFLTEDVVCLLFQGLPIVLRVDKKIVIEKVEKNAVVLLFADIVGQKSEKTVAALPHALQETLVDFVEQFYQPFMQLGIALSLEEHLQTAGNSDDVGRRPHIQQVLSNCLFDDSPMFLEVLLFCLLAAAGLRIVVEYFARFVALDVHTIIKYQRKMYYEGLRSVFR
jgi:hypothetical protein